MNAEERINNLIKVAEMQQLAIDKLTDDVSDLTKVVRNHQNELRVVQLTLARLAEGYHTH